MAENPNQEDGLAASMRPRHKAAENDSQARALPRHARDASMRPRHKAAENDLLEVVVGEPRAASMRPRHKAAENAMTSATSSSASSSFNEAAA